MNVMGITHTPIKEFAEDWSNIKREVFMYKWVLNAARCGKRVLLSDVAMKWIVALSN